MNAPEPIPQLDLAAQYAAIGDEIREAIRRVLASQQFVLGQEGAALEQEVARLCSGDGGAVADGEAVAPDARGKKGTIYRAPTAADGVAQRGGVAPATAGRHGVGVASGTDALMLALRASGVRAGDEVILPPFTFVATGSAVTALGAKPVFADIHPNTYNLDPAQLERRVTPRTRAIIAVHLYGLPADMDAIVAFARARKLPVIEDNAQAIGAGYKGRRTGSLGDMACLSFYPTKNLGAYGDAGMIVTNSAETAARLRSLRNHGQSAKYVSSEPGWNSRLDELQAAILRVKLRHLGAWQLARQAHAAAYTRHFAQLPGIMPPLVPEGYEHVFHQYTIRVENRDALRDVLVQQKIGSAVYYPVPLHLQPLYAELGYKRGDFPHAEHAAEEVLSLPMYPELRPTQVARVAETVVQFVKAHG